MFLNNGIQRRSPLTMTKGFRNRGSRASKVLAQFYPIAALGSFYNFAIVKKPPWRICIDSKKNRGKSANPSAKRRSKVAFAGEVMTSLELCALPPDELS